MTFADPIHIDDPDDPRLDDYRGMTDAELRRRRESARGRNDGIFVAEGLFVIERLLVSRFPVESILVNPSKWQRLAAAGWTTDAPVYVGTRELLASVAGFNVHRGALAIGTRIASPTLDEVIAGARLVAVLDGLTNAENAGAIFRSAAALGVDAVLLSPNCVDPLYRRAVRVSMGEVLALPWRVARSWPEELVSLAEVGFRVVGLDPVGTVGFDDLPGDVRVALVLGEEGPGISPAVRAMVDASLSIPMRPGPDSLNVAAAAAIAFHRLGRL